MKEVYEDLKADVNHRFDAQDSILARIDSRLSDTPTNSAFRELRTDVGTLGGRVQTIEDERREEAVRREGRHRTWRHAWATVTAVLVPVSAALIIVYMHR